VYNFDIKDNVVQQLLVAALTLLFSNIYVQAGNVLLGIFDKSNTIFSFANIKQNLMQKYSVWYGSLHRYSSLLSFHTLIDFFYCLRLFFLVYFQ